VENQNQAPLLDAYLKYFSSSNLPFTIPGHKQKIGRLDPKLGKVVDSDTPLYGGLDEIKLTNGTLTNAENLAAELWGASHARFSTGGSTHCNQAILLAIAKPGEKIAISRTSHRSLLSAIVLAGLEPIWMMPEVDQETGFPIGIPLSEIERVIAQSPTAIFLTEPGYLGTISDLKPIIQKAHDHNIPVIIDAAWGGHFGFNQNYPNHVLQLGADALVTSIHKALPGYSASALLLVQDKYIDLGRVDQSFETTHTTSPAGAPLASIDGVRALLARDGEKLLGQLLENVNNFKHRVESEVERKIFLSVNDFPTNRFDPAKLVLKADLAGIDGIELERALINVGIRVEMADRDTVVFLATIADQKSDFDALADKLIPILKSEMKSPRKSITSISWSIKPERVISMRDAYFAKTELVYYAEARNRISADLIAPYPPGVAVVAPGEKLTDVIIDGLRTTKASGVRIAYATDSSLEKFRVVSE
jgi:lysine decarboxylase